RRLQRGEIETERGDDAGPIIFDENVCRAGQPLQRVAAAGRLEIEDYAALAAVHRVEARAVAPRGSRHRSGRVAAGRFDLDHVGAEVGKEHGTERTGHHLRDVEHTQPRERTVIHRAFVPEGGTLVHYAYHL